MLNVAIREATCTGHNLSMLYSWFSYIWSFASCIAFLCLLSTVPSLIRFRAVATLRLSLAVLCDMSIQAALETLYKAAAC